MYDDIELKQALVKAEMGCEAHLHHWKAVLFWRDDAHKRETILFKEQGGPFFILREYKRSENMFASKQKSKFSWVQTVSLTCFHCFNYYDRVFLKDCDDSHVWNVYGRVKAQQLHCLCDHAQSQSDDWLNISLWRPRVLFLLEKLKLNLGSGEFSWKHTLKTNRKEPQRKGNSWD